MNFKKYNDKHYSNIILSHIHSLSRQNVKESWSSFISPNQAGCFVNQYQTNESSWMDVPVTREKYNIQYASSSKIVAKREFFQKTYVNLNFLYINWMQ